jgi:chromatin remodeling complex protein RSC6
MPSVKSNVNVNNMPVDKKTVSKKTVETTTTSAPPKTPAVRKEKVEVTVPTVSTTETTLPVETLSASDVLSTLQETLKTLSNDVSTRLRSAVHEAQQAVKAMKRDARLSKKRHRKDPSEMTPEEKATWESRRANNAFLKLRPITDELASFMGLPSKSQKSQTDVTKFIAGYVKSHSCFDPTFKRRILPDAKLAKLLRVKDGQEVTYLNLQSFLKVHFVKPAVTA